MSGIADVSSTRKRRRWYRFSLRSLFVLTLLAAVALGYHAHRLRRYEVQQRAEDTIRSMGGNVYISPQPVTWWQRLAGPAYTTYGETEVAFIMGPMGDAELAVLGRHLPNLPQLKRLILAHEFRDGTSSTLWLWSYGVGRYAEYLRNQPPCADTETTDRGLSHLGQLTDLDELLIHGSRITDDGLEHLRGLTKLKQLWLVRTGVTQAGAQRLRAALPNCEINVVEPSEAMKRRWRRF